MVGRMMMDFGITVNQLNACLCSIPLFEENITALKLAQSAGAMNFILSDANHHYISTILEHHNISSSFIQFVTNLSHIEDEEAATIASSDAADTQLVSSRLRISPHQPADSPHSCALCPPNLCKGNVLDKWREQYLFHQVVYIGDGGGDFCPALRLCSSDTVLCRQDYPLHKKCVAAKTEQSQHQLAASVVQWLSGNDILASFQDMFKSSSR